MADTNDVSGPDGEKPQATATSDDPQSEENRGTFVPLIFGGALATALGFFGAQLDSIEAALGLSQDNGVLEETIAEQDRKITAQSETIGNLRATLDALPPPAPPVDLSEMTRALEDQGTLLTSVSEQLAALDARLTELEKRPMTENVSEEAIAAYEAALGELSATVQAQKAEVEALLGDVQSSEAAAEESAKVALARAALTRLVVAVDSGAPYVEAMDELTSASGIEIPAVLTERATDGVPTQAMLQDAFPEAARSALAEARKEDAASGNGGLGAYLQRQLNVRSTTPQDGDDPDAVLSRAEAAVRDGRLEEALTEIAALPDTAKAPLADWVALAETRMAAKSAATELMTALSGN